MSTATENPTEATENQVPNPAEGESEDTNERTGRKRATSTAVRLLGTRYESFVNGDRFQPGYDAKAKSQMIKDAIQNEDPALAAEAVAALGAMNWTPFLEAKRRVDANRSVSGAERERRAQERSEKNEATKAARAAAKAASGKAASGKAASGKSNEELNAELETPAPDEGLYVRKGKSGWFVMQGEKGLKKFHTEDEAQSFIREQEAASAPATAATETATDEAQG